MLTSDERHEVAKRLRIGTNVPSIEGFTFKTLINAALTDGQPMPINDAELMSCLADLIDPTCEDVSEPPESGGFWPAPHFKCSVCGTQHVSVGYVRYCPNCGARVVSGDE